VFATAHSAPTGIVTSALFARWYLHEKFDVGGYIGILWSVVGGVCIAVSMPRNEHETAMELLQKNVGGAFSVFAIATVTLALVLSFRQKHGLFSVVYVLGTFGCMCSLASRAVASGVDSSLNNVLYYAVFMIMVLAIVAQCITFQRALAHHPLIRIAPLHYSAMQIMLAAGASLLYDDLTYATHALFWPGLVFSAVGCVAVSNARHVETTRDGFTQLKDITLTFKEDETKELEELEEELDELCNG
jgi:hypothetical protein